MKAEETKKPKRAAKADGQTKAEIIQSVLDGMYAQESASEMCRRAGISLSLFFKWVNEDPDVGEQYARAREARADVFFEQLDDIGEDAMMAESAVQVAGLRLKADNLKWKLARMAPKKYGEKLQTEHSGSVDVTLYDGEQAKRMAAMLNGTKSS